MDGFVVGDRTQAPIVISLSIYPGSMQVMEAGSEVAYIGWTNSLAPLWFIERYLERYKLLQVYFVDDKRMQVPSNNMIVPSGYTPSPKLLAEIPANFLKAIGYTQVVLPVLAR